MIRKVLAAMGVFLSFNAQAAETKTDGDAKKVAITKLEARGVDDDTVALVTELVAAELTSQSGLQVISGSNVKSVVSLEQQRQMLGCTGDDCYTYLGGLLRAERLITGSIDAVDDGLLISLQIIHSQKAEVLGRSAVESKNERKAIVAAVAKGVELLLEIPARVHLYGQVDRGRVMIDDEIVGVMPLKPFPIKKAGTATLRVEHYDYPDFETELELERGRTSRVRLDMTSFVELESKRNVRRTAGWITGGASVLAFVGGSLLLAEGYSKADQYQASDLRRTTQAELDATAGDSKAFLAGGYTAIGVGAIALGTSLYLLLVDPYESQLGND